MRQNWTLIQSTRRHITAHMMHTIRASWLMFCVTVNSLHPGFVDTELQRHSTAVGVSNDFILCSYVAIAFDVDILGMRTHIMPEITGYKRINDLPLLKT